MIKVITLCSGYDAQCLALERLKKNYPLFDYELVAWAEADPESKKPIEKQPAVIAHNALFPQWSDRNLGDITKVDWTKVPKCDLLFYSTPCQSISSAGLQHGFTKGSGTRSSIIWDVRDAIEALRPKYLILENVKSMVSKKFIDMFNLWQLELENLGYSNFASILNALDYNIPQHRERVFLVSVLKGEKASSFNFPSKLPLEKKLLDVLEKKVDEKYYLRNEIIGC